MPEPLESSPNGALSLIQIKEWDTDLTRSGTTSKIDPIGPLSTQKPKPNDKETYDLRLKGVGPEGAYPGAATITQSMTSGRCWIFSVNNVLRYSICSQLSLPSFQLSGTYTFFWDKLEKANYYLENIIATKDQPEESPFERHLNQCPLGDGTHRHMSANLFEKYGIVPLEQYGESPASQDTAQMNRLLTSKVREYGLRLRATPDRALKARFLAQIYRILCISLGRPPQPDQSFKWAYGEKEWQGTPVEFYRQFGKHKVVDLAESVALVNDPRNEYGKLYTVERAANVWGGRPVEDVNAPIEVLENAVITSIKADVPVSFNADIFASASWSDGVLDTELYDLQGVYGVTVNMSKAERLRTADSQMNHVMVITAVHLDEAGRPARYEVENSWPESLGPRWFTMTAEWFREYVYLVAVPKSVLDKKWVELLDGEAVVLSPWDMLGAVVG